MPKQRNYRYKKPKIKGHFFKKAFKAFLVLFLVSIPIGVLGFFQLTKNLPDPSDIASIDINESTKIYDKTGKIILYDIHGEEKRTIIPKDQMNQYVRDATLAAEDNDFYLHSGIDFKSIMRALFKDFVNLDKGQGASTITQQLVKNLFLTPEKTITRKLKEAILSIKLERSYSKEEILTFYLNQIPYGSNAYGVEAAARTFFNKEAIDLTLGESALLAAVANAPSYYSPYGFHKDELMQRKDYVLGRMHSIGFISDQEWEQAKNETIVFSEESRGIKAPHFVAYVKDYLENKYGYDYVQKAGLKVYTTLDYNVQQLAEDTIKNSKADIEKRGASNAAMAVIDSKTGQILAMVGSLDYFDTEHEGNYNVTLAKRQPGSSFKPFVYSKLFEKGFTPETMLFDSETEFSVIDDPEESYKPQNYDGKFRGPIAVKSALAQSLNVPAVKALYIAGIDDVLDLVKDMGITTLNDRSRLGLSLVLGGAEVKPLEMAGAFSVFSNNGVKNPLASILKIEDANGNILEEWRPDPKTVLEPNIAKTITSILSDNSLRAPVFGENNWLKFKNIDVAAKTGTTQEFRDAWTVGYTTNVAVAVWVGNNDNSPLNNNSSGGVTAAPIFNRFMNGLSQIMVFGNFDKPEPLVRDKSILNGGYVNETTLKLDKTSGKLATDMTPQDMIIEKTYRSVHNILHYINKNDILGPAPLDPTQDSQYENWEIGVKEWIDKNPQFNYTSDAVPTEYDDIHTEANKPKITITSPSQNEVSSDRINAQAEIASNYSIKEVDFFVNGKLMSSMFSAPYQAQLSVARENSGVVEIKVKAYDIYENSSEATVLVVKP